MSDFKKSLNLYSLTMIAIGAAIGSGIFRSAGTKVAAHIPDPTWVYAIWFLGGLVTLTGALTFAELGTMFTKRGGMYVYIREAFGDLTAFLYGWALLFVTNTGSIAGLVVVFTDFLKYIIPFGADPLFAIGPISVTPALIIQILVIVILTAINVLGVDLSKLFANVFTTAKLLGIALVIGVGIFLLPDPVKTQALVETAKATPPMPTTSWGLITAMLTGLVGVLWSYGGWQHTTFVVGEAQEPEKTVPRAMIIGALVITTVYMLANVAYLNLLPMNVLASSKQVAADAMSVVFDGGAKWISALICLSVLGTTGIYILSCPRIYFAMAEDKIFFKKLAELHPKYKTPANAIIAQSGWAIVLLLFWGSFENLIDYVTFVDWIFYGLTGLCVFVFRKKLANAPRSYKVPLYPLVPAFFCFIAFAFVLNAMFTNYIQAIAGLIVLGLGTVVYAYFKKQNIN